MPSNNTGGGSSMFSYGSLMTIVKDWFGLIAVLVGALTFVGFSVSTPWPARADVEKITQDVQSIQSQVKDQNCLVLRLLLKSYEDDLELANKELAENPGSVSARNAKRDAEQTISDIKAQIKSTCGLILPTHRD